MTDFLVMADGIPEHYFLRAYEGICVKKRNAMGVWQKREQVYKEATSSFGVYADKEGNVHIICVNKENELVYLVRRDGSFKKYVLAKLNSEIFVSNMRLYNVGGRLNLLYSALYNGENLLVHCILGDHAKPATIAKLETSHFCIFNSKVYFTDSTGTLGYVLLADEKPSGFTKLYDDAHFPTVISVMRKELLVFTRESKLYINGEEILYDSRMEMPFLVKGDNKIYAMWKSSGFIRYITSFNGGITWSEPMRFMASGTNPKIFIYQKNNEFRHYYGYFGDKALTLLAGEDVFRVENEYTLPDPNEFEKLKIMLDITRQEVIDAKKEIEKLNHSLDIIKELK